MVKISPDASNRQGLIDILRTVMGPTGAAAGCRTSTVFEEYDDASVLYLELWDSEEKMRQHIRSTLYTRVLEAMELSLTRPEINFYTIVKTEGLDFINEVRGSGVM